MRSKTTAIQIIAAALLLVSCGDEKKEVQTVEGFALGTVYAVTVVEQIPDSLQEKVEAVFTAADNSMSVFNENSLLSRLNRNETDIPDEDIIYNIELARKVSELSHGRYDITVQPLTEAYGFITGKQREGLDIDSLLQYVGYEKIEIRDGRLIKEHPEMRIDLNSIAKGHIVDKIARMLEKEGVTNYLVNVGGEVFCRGTNPQGDRWRIAIDTPFEGNYIQGADTRAVISVTEVGVATSGNYRNFRIGADGKKYTHIINPTTGENTSSSLLSATVVAESCAYADALGTMFIVLGMDDSLSLLATRSDIAVLLIYADNAGDMQLYVSPAMKKYMP